MNKTPLFEYPISEDIARSLIVHPDMKVNSFKEPIDVITALESYPRPDLLFANAYEALASRFNLLVLHEWQLGIVTEIKAMLKKHYGGLK